jgi:hypothetical protein
MSDLSEEIQEIKQELQQVKERNKELEQKIEKQESGKNSSDSAGKSENISRRKFLKMAGLGAGVIGLSSATSAWSILQPSSQGTSDIDADTVDGSEAGGFIQASETDDLSDITLYEISGTYYSDETTINFLNLSGGGTLLGGYFYGDANTETDLYMDITIDGGSTQRIKPAIAEGDIGTFHMLSIPPFRFETSLDINVFNSYASYPAVQVWIKQ